VELNKLTGMISTLATSTPDGRPAIRGDLARDRAPSWLELRTCKANLDALDETAGQLGREMKAAAGEISSPVGEIIGKMRKLADMIRKEIAASPSLLA